MSPVDERINRSLRSRLDIAPPAPSRTGSARLVSTLEVFGFDMEDRYVGLGDGPESGSPLVGAEEPPALPRGEEVALNVTSENAEVRTYESGLSTAKRAVSILAQGGGYRAPTGRERRAIAMAFAGAGRVVYGQAFDVLKVEGEDPIDLANAEDVSAQLRRITLCEVKSTNRDLDEDFRGYFFSLSTAELLVAQSLGAQFLFLLVNVRSGRVLPLRLQELYGRARAIYPGWSITL